MRLVFCGGWSAVWVGRTSNQQIAVVILALNRACCKIHWAGQVRAWEGTKWFICRREKFWKMATRKAKEEIG